MHGGTGQRHIKEAAKRCTNYGWPVGPTLNEMKLLFRAVAGSCLVAVAILLLSWTTYFAELNYTAYDFALRLAGTVPIKSPTLIVAIDEDSLHRVGGWPWSRDKLARIIDRIEGATPLAIGVDLLLDEKTSQDSDFALATAIANAHEIVLAAHLDSSNGAERWNEPNPLFLQNHARLGHVHTDPDFDGISRRVLSAKAAESGPPVRAFAVQMLHAAGLPFKADFERKAGPADILRPQPVNIRFVGDNNSFRQVPAWRILDGSADIAQFRNQIVLIGFTAEGEGDRWFTPFAESGSKMSGVEIHANAIETLHTGRAIAETPALLLLAGIAVFILLLWWLDGRFEGRRFYIAALATGPGFLALSWLLMKYANLWLPFPPFWAALVVVVPGLEVVKLVRVNRDLDGKIEKLSTGWLTALHWYEGEWPQSGTAGRAKLFAKRRRNSRWKLDAIDFFNDELMRFLCFNNAILANIEDVIIVADSNGNVVFQNTAAKALAGYRENPGSAQTYLASILDLPDFRIEPGILNFVATKAGKTFYNVTVAPISAVGVVYSLYDATAQHELNQAKSEMVSLVSHELRTPLTSIRGYSDMLLKYNLVQDKGKDFLATIVEESNRLNQLIQSFLDIAYIESGRQKITMSEFDIAPVLRDLLNVTRPVAAEKEIVLESPNNLNGLRVRADRLLLYQALTNLVTNAIKYSPAGTTVSLGISNGEGALRFQVADEGFGIPPEEASKIFEKFYRRGNKETREQSGFGLGLAFVKEVATRHGGHVIVESEVGKGSVFTLSIPN